MRRDRRCVMAQRDSDQSASPCSYLPSPKRRSGLIVQGSRFQRNRHVTDLLSFPVSDARPSSHVRAIRPCPTRSTVAVHSLRSSIRAFRVGSQHRMPVGRSEQKAVICAESGRSLLMENEEIFIVNSCSVHVMQLEVFHMKIR